MSRNKSVSVLFTDVDEREAGSMPKLRVSLIDGILFLSILKESETNKTWHYESIAEIGIDYNTFCKVFDLIENEDNVEPSFPVDLDQIMGLIKKD